MEDTVNMALWILRALAGLMWAGAVAFAVYRVYQMATLRLVEAEVLQAHTDSSWVTGEDEDASGFRREYSHRVYRAEALVRYEYKGREYTSVARHVTESGSRSGVDRLVRQWKPGTRIRVHLDPRKPDQPRVGLGLNLSTFRMAIVLVAAGYAFVGFGWVVRRVAAYVTELMGK